MNTTPLRTRARTLSRSVLFLLSLGAAPVVSAEVALRIAWELDGPLSELQQSVQRGVALQKRINPEVRHELWVDEIHGSGGGGASLVVLYRDLAHHAEAVAREEADPEWQAFIESFPAERFPTSYVGLMSVVVGEGLPSAGEGEVLNIFAFDLNGPPEQLAEVIREAAEIQQEAGLPVELRLVTPLIAGDDNAAVLLARSPSLRDYADTAEKLAANEAWQAFMDEFPADRYPLSYRGLSRAIAIN